MNRANENPVVQPVFKPLDLGTIKPLGWFKGELELEAQGLAGNMFDFYRFVNDSGFLGGSTEYSTLHEGSPYWFNGVVPLAFGLGDARIESQVRYYLDYVLDAQQSDGWIGWETTQATRGLWARTRILLGLTVSFFASSKLLRHCNLCSDTGLAICRSRPNPDGEDC